VSADGLAPDIRNAALIVFPSIAEGAEEMAKVKEAFQTAVVTYLLHILSVIPDDACWAT
jgi:hypothetical protein